MPEKIEEKPKEEKAEKAGEKKEVKEAKKAEKPKEEKKKEEVLTEKKEEKPKKPPAKKEVVIKAPAEEKKEQMIFTIPLKDAWRVAYKKRAKKCMFIIRQFAARHMKSPRERIKIGQQLNQALWAKGPKSPPREVKVQAVPQEIETKAGKAREIWIELAGIPFVYPKEAKREEERKGKIAAMAERIAGKEKVAKVEKKVEKEEKKESKEEKK